MIGHQLQAEPVHIGPPLILAQHEALRIEQATKTLREFLPLRHGGAVHENRDHGRSRREPLLDNNSLHDSSRPSCSVTQSAPGVMKVDDLTSTQR